MCAMQAMTIDALAGGGRMIVGLGVSGPQIVEGWYGQPWGKPYWRVRDYVEMPSSSWRTSRWPPSRPGWPGDEARDIWSAGLSAEEDATWLTESTGRSPSSSRACG